MMAEYIEREAALLSLTPIVKRASERNRNIYSAVKQCVEAINWCPAADVQPVRRGRWVSVPHKKARICSQCEQDEPYKFADEDANVFNFCPNCGAKMDFEVDDG